MIERAASSLNDKKDTIQAPIPLVHAHVICDSITPWLCVLCAV